MANHRARVEKPQGGLASVLKFVNKNWQGIAIILGIVAVFVWYQALGLGTLFNRQQESVETSDEAAQTEEIQDQTPPEEAQDKSKEDTLAQAPTPTEPPSQTPAATSDMFVQKAAAGQGITHLARGALQDYLTSVKPEVDISREQKIYIEDYLKDVVSPQKITPGKELSFSRESIAQAIELSQTLTPKELSNLTQYANRVPSLQAYQPVQ